MKRPDFVTNEDLSRWDESIENDEDMTPELANEPLVKEICYAGLWLCEELDKLGCPSEFRNRIQFTAGKLGWGRDFWQVNQELLERYKQNQLDYEVDPLELN